MDDSRFETTSGIIDYLLGKKNLGLGLDFGATYEVSDRLMVSAAITDIGYIKWKRDVTNLKTKNQFEFSGLNMLDVLNGTKTFEEVGNEMLDSLKNSFTVTDSNNQFTTWLPVGITLGGSYKLTRSFNVGLLSYTRIISHQLREYVTLSANLNLGNAFSTSLSYTAGNHRYDNLGAGLSFRTGIFQFYILADRIPMTWNKIKTENSNLPIPSVWNTVNLRFGMNLAFGNKVKKKDDKPMVVVEEYLKK